MDLGNFINTYQYVLLPALLAVTAGLILVTLLALVLWTGRDITTRSKNLPVIILSIFLVLIFNLPGLLIYLLLRPNQTIDERKNFALIYQSILDKDIINCSSCHLPLRVDHEFCPNCGTAQNIFCTQCNGRVNPLWQHCPDCGNDLKPSRPFVEKVNTIIAQMKTSLQGLATRVFNFPKSVWQSYVQMISKLTARLPRRKISVNKKPAKVKKTENKQIAKPKVAKQPVVLPVPQIQIAAAVATPTAIKYNKDGTPRKPRNDAGRKRGKYKPRQESK